mgnify:CR=1 FL=1
MHAVQLSESNTHNCVIFVSLKQHKMQVSSSLKNLHRDLMYIYMYIDLPAHGCITARCGCSLQKMELDSLMQQRRVRKLEFLAPFSPWSFELVPSECRGRHAAGIGPSCLCRSRCLFASLYRSGPHTACSQGVSSIATIG